MATLTINIGPSNGGIITGIIDGTIDGAAADGITGVSINPNALDLSSTTPNGQQVVIRTVISIALQALRLRLTLRVSVSGAHLSVQGKTQFSPARSG